MIPAGHLELHKGMESTATGTFIGKYIRCIIIIQTHLTDNCLNIDDNNAVWSSWHTYKYNAWKQQHKVLEGINENILF